MVERRRINRSTKLVSDLGDWRRGQDERLDTDVGKVLGSRSLQSVL